MKASNIEKYLDRYAEPESVCIRSLCDTLHNHSGNTTRYQRCLIVPTYDETPDFFRRLAKVPGIEKTIVVVVINQPFDTQERQLNSKLHNHILSSGKNFWQKENVCFVQTGSFDTIVVDRFGHNRKIPTKQGVGLARKIASDIACACYFFELTQTEWVYSTDADAHLPNDYFTIENNNSAAKVYDFQHTLQDSDISRATQLYEQSLKYYRNGLRWAKSPYAFYTLGSTLAFRVEPYCAVRGFPKRSGAEDFYLLNKISKIGLIHQIENTKILLEPRLSHRVPFGTGPAVKSIVDAKKSEADFYYYNPLIFDALKHFLDWSSNELFHQIEKGGDITLPEYNDKNCRQNHTLVGCTEHLELNDFITHSKKQCKTPKSFKLHFSHWFDGFKTLKFIRFLEKNGFPSVPIKECFNAQQRWNRY